MKRRRLLTGSLTATAALFTSPGAGGVAAADESSPTPAPDEDLLARLTSAADAQVPDVVANYVSRLNGSPRTLTRNLRRVVVPFVSRRSRYHHDASLRQVIDEIVRKLVSVQHQDGTFDVGNLHSPPDTGFLIEDFGVMSTLLGADDHPDSGSRANAIREMMRKAGPALATGGVHTPNHRWKVCAALARINQVSPRGEYVRRIDEWLAEGIDQDADGMYSERSPNYAAAVTNPSLLTVAWLLGRPRLVEPVRRNLEMTMYHLDHGGEVEAVHSRRQDQDGRIMYVRDFYLQYRELALRDGNGRFAAIARGIEHQHGAELGDALGDVLEKPRLAGSLPDSKPLPTRFARVFGGAQLARVRRESTSVSIFGGTDWYQRGEPGEWFNRFGSGLSTSPTFLRLRRGSAVLDSLRMSPSFFSMGHFRSRGLTRTRGDGFRLWNALSVPYHLPLPAQFRRADGDYPLTAEGRFFAKMDFPHRPKQYRVLRTEILVSETGDGFDVDFLMREESDVPVTIELCFRKGGVLSGVERATGEDNFHLVEGFGMYTMGADRIEFGPGNGRGTIAMDAGEQYSQHNGTLVASGYRVYITGRTPLSYRLTLRPR